MLHPHGMHSHSSCSLCPRSSVLLPPPAVHRVMVSWTCQTLAVHVTDILTSSQVADQESSFYLPNFMHCLKLISVLSSEEEEKDLY